MSESTQLGRGQVGSEPRFQGKSESLSMAWSCGADETKKIDIYPDTQKSITFLYRVACASGVGGGGGGGRKDGRTSSRIQSGYRKVI